MWVRGIQMSHNVGLSLECERCDIKMRVTSHGRWLFAYFSQPAGYGRAGVKVARAANTTL